MSKRTSWPHFDCNSCPRSCCWSACASTEPRSAAPRPATARISRMRTTLVRTWNPVAVYEHNETRYQVLKIRDIKVVGVQAWRLLVLWHEPHRHHSRATAIRPSINQTRHQRHAQVLANVHSQHPENTATILLSEPALLARAPQVSKARRVQHRRRRL